MRYAFVILAALALGACSTVTDMFGGADLSLLQKAAETGGKVESATLGNAMKSLPLYCKLPKSARALMRSRANARPEAGGNKIGVFCVGDPVLPLGS